MTTVSTARRQRRRSLAAGLLAVATLLGGCTTFSADGGFSTAEQAAKERLGKELRWSRSEE
ncbi:MAG TPA: RND transporter, partial [Burkholderiaceae bacterium]|nr:RND transporter [Burkholderiaceae bacterium]